MSNQNLYEISDQKIAILYKIYDKIKYQANHNCTNLSYEKTKNMGQDLIDLIKSEISKTSFHYEIKELKFLIMNIQDLIFTSILDYDFIFGDI